VRGQISDVSAPAPLGESLLGVRSLSVRYAAGTDVICDLSLEVRRGEIVALLGANGAGKTTLLRAITGLLGIHRGRIAEGAIEFGGRRINGWSPAHIVKSGISQVMEGRRIFADLTIEENLRVGGFVRTEGARYRANVERVLALFPILAERLHRPAGFLSGGEQQMLAIARALMSEPQLLLLDEPSLGVAPLMIAKIRDAALEINRAGMTVVLIEQNVTMALAMAHRAYVLERGRVVMSGTSVEIAANEHVSEAYLGMSVAGSPA
jgi:branched-chain amino acid transport system ATP-binding protein